MTQTSRYIPADIKREVRQRCGFGCVICGKPLYEYDHMTEWSVVKKHLAEEITLLCDEHHKSVTNKILSRETIKKANDEPYNILKGKSSGLQLIYDGDNCSIDIGGNKYSVNKADYKGLSAPILIDLIPIIEIEFENSHPLISVRLYDISNELIFHIIKNELFYSIEPWDVEFKGNVLTIREAKRKIILRIEFNPPDNINIISGRFYLNGVGLEITNEGIIVLNSGSKLSGNTVGRTRIGISIGNQDVAGAAFALGDVNERYEVQNIITE